MKKLTALFFVCLATLSLFAQYAPGLLNIDMSARRPDGLPEGWYYLGGADVVHCEYGEVRLEEHSNTTAAALIPFTGLQGGASYEFQCEMQCDADTECWIYVESRNTVDGGYLPPTGEKFRANGDWQTLLIQFTYPEDAMESRVVLRLLSPGNATFRNFQVREWGSASSLGQDVPGLLNIDMQERRPDGLPEGWNYIGGTDVIHCDYGEVTLEERGSTTAVALIPFTGLKADTSYEFQCEMQGDADMECWVYVESRTTTDGEYLPPTGEKFRARGDWQRQVVLFMPPEDAVESRLVLRLLSPGKATFRNFQVQECIANHGIRNTESMPAKVTLYNGNFEDGQIMWKLGPNTSTVRSYDDFGNTSLRMRTNGLVYQTDIRFRPNRVHRLVWFTKGRTDAVQELSVEVSLSNGMSFPKTCVVQPNQWTRDEIEFLVPEGEEVLSGQVSFLAGDKADMLVDEVFLREMDEDELLPVQAWVTSPANGSRIFSTMPVDAIQGGFKSQDDNVAAVTVALLKDGEVLQKSGELQPNDEFSFDAKNLAEGHYDLEFAPVDAQGNAMPRSLLPIDKLPPAKYEVTFDGNRTFYRNGKPFIPFMPLSAYAPIRDRLSLYVFAKNGVTSLVNEDMAMKRSLDLMAKAGMVRLVQTTNLVNLSKEDWQSPPEIFQPKFTAALEKALTSDIINHPAVLGYDHYDEAMAVNIPLVNYRYASQEVRRLDPYHPIFYNEAPRGVTKEYVAAYAKYADTVGTDLYPVTPDWLHSSFADKGLTATGKYVTHLLETVEFRKPIFIWLQAFSWGELNHANESHMPNYLENRFTNYDAMMHGASALLFYNDSNYSDKYYKECLLPSIREVSSMGGVFRLGTELPGVQVAEPIMAKLFEYQGEKYLVALNRSDKEIRAKFSGIQGDGTWTCLDEERTVKLANGAFKDTFTAYGVHVYSTASVYPEPITPRPAPNPEFDAREEGDIFAPYLASAPEFAGAYWIWFPGEQETTNSTITLTRTVRISKPVKKAIFYATVDNTYQASLNGEKIAEGHSWGIVSPANVTRKLKKGKNTFEIQAKNADGPAGVLVSIIIEYTDGTTERIISDSKWDSANANGNTASAMEVVPAGMPPWRWNVDIQEAK